MHSPAGERKFFKPWSQTLVMFCGEAMCLTFFLWKRRNAVVREEEDAEWEDDEARSSAYERMPPMASPALGGNAFTTPHLASKGESPTGEVDVVKPVTSGDVCICLLPACCDLGGTTLSGIGLLFTSASVFQMLRGSLMVFTGMFTVLFLKRTLPRYKVIGIAITVVGITLVGLSSTIFPIPDGDSGSGGHKNDTSSGVGFLYPEHSYGSSYNSGGSGGSGSTKGGSMVLVGNALVVISQLMSAFQMVIEVGAFATPAPIAASR